mmetsp:Transcript_20043/g.36201  ORF Transcript_20043/g.36201 Transcript_20043/m.36201 type:complete len:437 (+) Transcript_20043:115-1425(+)
MVRPTGMLLWHLCCLTCIHLVASIRPHENSVDRGILEASLVTSMMDALDARRSSLAASLHLGSYNDTTGEHCAGKQLEAVLQQRKQNTMATCSQDKECARLTEEVDRLLTTTKLLQTMHDKDDSATVSCDDDSIKAIIKSKLGGCKALTCLAECARRHKPKCADFEDYDEWCQKEFVGQFATVLEDRLHYSWYIERIKHGHGEAGCQERAGELEEEILKFPDTCYPDTCIDGIRMGRERPAPTTSTESPRKPTTQHTTTKQPEEPLEPQDQPQHNTTVKEPSKYATTSSEPSRGPSNYTTSRSEPSQGPVTTTAVETTQKQEASNGTTAQEASPTTPAAESPNQEAGTSTAEPNHTVPRPATGNNTTPQSQEANATTTGESPSAEASEEDGKNMTASQPKQSHEAVSSESLPSKEDMLRLIFEQAEREFERSKRKR